MFFKFLTHQETKVSKVHFILIKILRLKVFDKWAKIWLTSSKGDKKEKSRRIHGKERLLIKKAHLESASPQWWREEVEEKRVTEESLILQDRWQKSYRKEKREWWGGGREVRERKTTEQKADGKMTEKRRSKKDKRGLKETKGKLKRARQEGIPSSYYPTIHHPSSYHP